MEVIFNQFLLLHGCSDKTNRTYVEVQVCYSRLVLVKRFLQLMNQVNMQHEREN